MSKLLNIYGVQMEELEDYPYNRFHTDIMMFCDEIIFEFDDFVGYYFLDNKIIEYSLEFILIDKSELLSFDSTLSINNVNNFLNSEVKKIEYLHEINDKESIIDENSIGQELLYTRIGIRFEFIDGNELYLYSGEPDLLGNERYKMYRSADVICLQILDKEKGKIKLEKDVPFHSTYISLV